MKHPHKEKQCKEETSIFTICKQKQQFLTFSHCINLSSCMLHNPLSLSVQFIFSNLNLVNQNSLICMQLHFCNFIQLNCQQEALIAISCCVRFLCPLIELNNNLFIQQVIEWQSVEKDYCFWDGSPIFANRQSVGSFSLDRSSPMEQGCVESNHFRHCCTTGNFLSQTVLSPKLQLSSTFLLCITSFHICVGRDRHRLPC